MLLEVKSRLEELTDRRFEDAVGRRDHTAAIRFARLYKPLGRQVGTGLRSGSETDICQVAG